jgi:hypothetical protein
MAKARFEEYVEERVAELAKPKRDRLEAALKEAEEALEKQRDKYVEMVREGVAKLVREVVAQAKKDGCKVSKDTGEAEEKLSRSAEDRVRQVVGLQKEYDYDRRASLWPKGTVARRLQDALMAFDAFCEKESRRIVVYKMDLNMKPDAFEAMLAEVAEKIKEA